MTPALRFGTDSSLNLDLPDRGRLAFCAAPRGKPVEDVAGAVKRALAEPLGLPPLSKMALPEDKVVLALDQGVPHAATIVAKAIEALLAGGVQATDITLLRTQTDAESGAADPLAELPPNVQKAITLCVHDPSQRKSLSYLAASTDARPIYINRVLHDADLAISIGTLRLDGTLGYHGIGSSVFPTFSDTATLHRYRSPKATEEAEHKRLRKQTDEVQWLLGIQFTIQVVPGAGNHLLHLLAGETETVYREGSRLCQEAWSFPVPERASLVVATIEGDATQQTWENVARALAAASRALHDDGSVALCTDLAQRPGPGLQHILGADDLDEVLREVSEHRPADSLPAVELVHALQRGKVYLLSRLDDALVEDLGISPVVPGKISALIARYDSCIVLCNAHYALAFSQNESADAASAAPKSRK